MDKSQLRAFYRTRRAALHPHAVAAWGAAIEARLLAHPWIREAQTVLCYVDAGENEVRTRGIIDALSGHGVQIGLPVARAKGRLEWHHFTAWEELAPGRFDILEPKPGNFRPLTPPADAVCIVPGIAFTRKGHRIGYGGGYYDRFLAEFPGRSIGLCYEATCAPEWETEDHDRAVTLVITEAAQ